jgi:hypothetical protein
MSNTESFVRLGRFMIVNAPQFADDVTCNRWARVGQLLTGLGMPFAPRLRDFSDEDQSAVREAAAVMVGRAEMPPQLVFKTPDPERRTRKPRMTKVMTKPAKPAKTAKKVKDDGNPPKRRGRPPGSKNKTASKGDNKR